MTLASGGKILHHCKLTFYPGGMVWTKHYFVIKTNTMGWHLFWKNICFVQKKYFGVMEFQKIWYFWICLWVFYLKNLTLDLEIENWKFFRGDEKSWILNLHVFAGSPKIALLSIGIEKFFFPSAFPLFLLTFLWRFQIWPWFLSIYSSFWEILFHDFSWFLNQNG